MKFNFKKIAAIGASVLMTGMTMGVAAAASFPAPFVQDGAANSVAIVHGSGAPLDVAPAESISDYLAGQLKNGTSVTGGESFKLEKSSDKFNFGEDLSTVYSSLDDDELPNALADGTYDDGDIDEDFTQEITLGDSKLTLLKDEDVNDEEPTIGFKFEDGEVILNYTMDFDGSDVKLDDMNTTKMPLFGANYYVKTADENSIELLDTAEEHTLNLGESATIAGKTIKVEYIGNNKAKFTVDGETTDSLEENEEFKLNDGSYIIPTEIMPSNKESVTDSVEFALGSGKIILHNDVNNNVELNDDDVDGLFASYTFNEDGHTSIDKLTLTWKADDDTFLTEDETLVMPLFENIKLSFNGLDFPSETETISFDKGDTLTISMDNYDIPVMWTNDAETPEVKLGEEHHELIITPSDVTFTEAGYVEANVTATANNTTEGYETFNCEIHLNDGTSRTILGVASYGDTSGDTAKTAVLAEKYLTDIIAVTDDQRFVATKIADDLSDVETAYYEVSSLDAGDDTVLKLDDLIGDKDLEFDAIGDDKDKGDINVKLADFSFDKKTAYLQFDDVDAYDKLVSENGLVITIPSKDDVEAMDNDGSAAAPYTPAKFILKEASDDEDVYQGTEFEVDVKLNDDGDVIYVSNHNVTKEESEANNDLFISYVDSPLASKISFDKSGDENDFDVEYYGKEVAADVEVTAGGDVTTTGADIGNIILTDADSTAYADKNVIVVGGSCVNKAAAKLLGVPEGTCGSAWTAATGVSDGHYLIKGFVAPEGVTSETAILVAGYNAADTVLAAQYLTSSSTNDFDSSNVDHIGPGVEATE